MTRVRLLGPVEFDNAHGTPVSLAPRHQAVLAVLATAAGRTVPAHELVEAAWGPVGASLATLQSSMSRLRSRTGPDVVATVTGGYRLALPADEVDSHVFARMLTDARAALGAGDAVGASAAVHAASELWRGEPFGGAVVDGAQALEVERSRLNDLHLASYELHAEVALALGDDAAVVDLLSPVVADHPLRETLRVWLITALYRTGRQADALNVFDRGRRLLADELGVDPGPELRRVHEWVLRQDEALLRQDTPTEDPAPVTDSPDPDPSLLGRDDLVAELVTALQRTRSSGPVCRVLVGEAGIGKTFVAEQVGRQLTQAGRAVVWGRNLDHGGAASYWPWTQVLTDVADHLGPDLLRQAMSGPAAHAAVLLPPGQVPSDRPIEPAAVGSADRTRQHLFEAVVRFLEFAATQVPLTLVFEDLQWADDESLRLLEYASVSTVAGAALSVLATVRDPDTARITHDVVARVPRLQRHLVRGLSVDQVSQLAAVHLGQPVSPDAARRLHDRTDGNPFFVEELVRLLEAERRNGTSTSAGVPTTVRAAIERRLRHLDVDTRETLTAGAVLGRDFDLPSLAAVQHRELTSLVEPLDIAVAAGLLKTDGRVAGGYRFVHALVQETLLASTGPLRRAALHARAADTLATADDDQLDELAPTITHHLREAGVLADATTRVAFTLRTAAAADRRWACVDAETEARRGVALAQELARPDGVPWELRATVLLARVLTRQRGFGDPEIRRLWRRALDLHRQEATPGTTLPVLWGAWAVAIVSARHDEARARAHDLALAAGGDPLIELAHHHAAGENAFMAGAFRQAVTHLREALRLVDEHEAAIDLDVWLQHPAVVVRDWLATALTMLGDDAAAATVAAAAADRNRQLNHPFTAAYHHVVEAQRGWFRRRPDDAAEAAAAAVELARAHGFDRVAAAVRAPRAWARASRDDPAGGLAELELLTAPHQLPDQVFRPIQMLAHAEVLARSGNPGAAQRLADDALVCSRRTGELVHIAFIHALLAQVVADPVEAHRHRVRAHDVAAEQGCGPLLAALTTTLTG